MVTVSKGLKALCSETFVLFSIKYNEVQKADIELSNGRYTVFAFREFIIWGGERYIKIIMMQ